MEIEAYLSQSLEHKQLLIDGLVKVIEGDCTTINEDQAHAFTESNGEYVTQCFIDGADITAFINDDGVMWAMLYESEMNNTIYFVEM